MGKKQFPLNMDEELYKQIKALAKKRDETMTYLMNRILTNGVSEEAASDGIDAITIRLRKVMRDLLKPTEERLAKLAAKAAVGALTSQNLQLEILKASGKFDEDAIFRKCRTLAVAMLRGSDDDK